MLTMTEHKQPMGSDTQLPAATQAFSMMMMESPVGTTYESSGLPLLPVNPRVPILAVNCRLIIDDL